MVCSKYISVFINLASLSLSCGMWDTFFSCGLQDLLLRHVGSSSLTRDQTWAPTLGARSLIHWTPGKSMVLLFSSLPFNQSRKYTGTLSNFVKSQRWYVASPGFSSGVVASEPLTLHTCWRTSRGSSLTSCVVLGVTLDFPAA